MTDAQIISLALAAAGVLAAVALLWRTERGRTLLFDVAARIITAIGARIEAHAIAVLDALIDRLMERLGDRDPVAWQDLAIQRYERATGTPVSRAEELPY